MMMRKKRTQLKIEKRSAEHEMHPLGYNSGTPFLG
jgi:hypothetical protein